MRPETLERLVTLKAQYPGAVNLFELEACFNRLLAKTQMKKLIDISIAFKKISKCEPKLFKSFKQKRHNS